MQFERSLNGAFVLALRSTSYEITIRNRKRFRSNDIFSNIGVRNILLLLH